MIAGARNKKVKQGRSIRKEEYPNFEYETKMKGYP